MTFQLESICCENTDEDILKALEDLPKDLPTTYRRILGRLRKAESTNPSIGKKVFEIVSAARRPLTLEELREAISIEPGVPTWNSARIVNDVVKLLGCCGSLVIVDEEFSTVHFAHSSVQQHLETIPIGNDISEYHIATKKANLLMGEIVVTYLNLDVLQKMLTNTSSSSQTLTLPDVTLLLKASLPPQKFATNLARKLLENRKMPGYDVGRDLERVAGFKREQQSRSLKTHSFLPYAQEHWLSHTESFRILYPGYEDRKCISLWERLIDGSVRTVALPWTSEDARALNSSFQSLVVQSRNAALVEYTCRNMMRQAKSLHEIRRFIELLPPYELSYKISERGSYFDVVLRRAVSEKNGVLVKLLLDKTPADPNSHAVGHHYILNEALTLGNLEIVKVLINHGAYVNAKEEGYDFATPPLASAAVSSFGKETIPLLLASGAAKIPILDSYRDEMKRVLEESYDVYDKKNRPDKEATARKSQWNAIEDSSTRNSYPEFANKAPQKSYSLYR